VSADPHGVRFVDSTGRTFGPGAEVAPLDLGTLEPWEEQRYLEVAPDAVFGTNEGRLLAEGWNPSRPDIHDVVRRREALRFAMIGLAARKADASSIARAINRSDPDEILAAVMAVGLEMWASANFGTPDSILSHWSWQLETQFRKAMFDHRVSVLRSLVGRDSAAAERLRRYLVGIESVVELPPLMIPEYVIYP
jgi:hypothetical protein